MMGRKSKQLNMAMLNMEDLIPQDHLLRKIKADTRDQSDLDLKCPSQNTIGSCSWSRIVPGTTFGPRVMPYRTESRRRICLVLC